MSSENHEELASAFGPDVTKEMVKFGITRVSIDHFHYKDFRYTNVKDAIAQAKRQQAGAVCRLPENLFRPGSIRE